MTINYRSALEQAKGSLATLEKQKNKWESEVKEFTIRLNNGVLPAQVFFQKIAQETQEKIQIHIEDIVQLALDAVFPNRYTFRIMFEMKRGKTEATMFLEQDGEQMNPMDSNGGGVVDILALALRISAYTLSRTRNTIILDEPMRFVSRDLQEHAATIIKELSDKIGIQFIITTHAPEITVIADRVFKTIIKNGRTTIKHIDPWDNQTLSVE